jgi:hypothetical protein
MVDDGNADLGAQPAGFACLKRRQLDRLAVARRLPDWLVLRSPGLGGGNAWDSQKNISASSGAGGMAGPTLER